MHLPVSDQKTTKCARETCDHPGDQHNFQTDYGREGYAKCLQNGCDCRCFIAPIGPYLNPNFPGPNQTMIVGKQVPEVDLGTSQDQLLVACLETLMRLCKHDNIMPAQRVLEAHKVIQTALDQADESCEHCRLHGSQGGWRHDGNHLYGCEVQKKLKARHKLRLEKEKEEQAERGRLYREKNTPTRAKCHHCKELIGTIVKPKNKYLSKCTVRDDARVVDGKNDFHPHCWYEHLEGTQ